MKNKLWILITSLYCPLLWAHPSLFFTQHEAQQTTSAQGFHLSAIIYIDPHHWSIYVNDQMIHSNAPLQIKGLHIEEVTPQRVKLLWRPSPEVTPIRFTLRPQQTFFIKL